jgi:hypothetical protein
LSINKAAIGRFFVVITIITPQITGLIIAMLKFNSRGYFLIGFRKP